MLPITMAISILLEMIYSLLSEFLYVCSGQSFVRSKDFLSTLFAIFACVLEHCMYISVCVDLSVCHFSFLNILYASSAALFISVGQLDKSFRSLCCFPPIFSRPLYKSRSSITFKGFSIILSILFHFCVLSVGTSVLNNFASSACRLKLFSKLFTLSLYLTVGLSISLERAKGLTAVSVPLVITCVPVWFPTKEAGQSNADGRTSSFSTGTGVSLTGSVDEIFEQCSILILNYSVRCPYRDKSPSPQFLSPVYSVLNHSLRIRTFLASPFLPGLIFSNPIVSKNYNI